MAKYSKISWTNATFNIVTGCRKVSPGCAHCYAERNRFTRNYWGPTRTTPRQTRSGQYWKQPLSWNRWAEQRGVPIRVLCGSFCDTFEEHPTVVAQLPRLWSLIHETPHLRWLLLTKRPERINRSLPGDWNNPDYAHVWLGTSVENQHYADKRLEFLRRVPTFGRAFVSAEPLLGFVDLSQHLDGVGWVICGGESGPGARPMCEDWALTLQAQCAGNKVAFFYKQDGGKHQDTIRRHDVWLQQFPVVMTSIFTDTDRALRATATVLGAET